MNTPELVLHLLIFPIAVETVNPIGPQLDRGAVSDAEYKTPKALVDPVKDAPTDSDEAITFPDSDEEQNDELPVCPLVVRPKFYAHRSIQPYSDAEDELSPPCEELSAKAKGKYKAIEPESEPEGSDISDGSTQRDTEYVVSSNLTIIFSI